MMKKVLMVDFATGETVEREMTQDELDELEQQTKPNGDLTE